MRKPLFARTRASRTDCPYSENATHHGNYPTPMGLDKRENDMIFINKKFQVNLLQVRFDPADETVSLSHQLPHNIPSPIKSSKSSFY